MRPAAPRVASRFQVQGDVRQAAGGGRLTVPVEVVESAELERVDDEGPYPG